MRAGQLAQACFVLLEELLHPLHGLVRETAATALRPLTNGILGIQAAAQKSEGGASARTGQAVRQQILRFVERALM